MQLLGQHCVRIDRRQSSYGRIRLEPGAKSVAQPGANDLKAIFRWGHRLKPEALLDLFDLKKGGPSTRNGSICSARSMPMRSAAHSANSRLSARRRATSLSSQPRLGRRSEARRGRAAGNAIPKALDVGSAFSARLSVTTGAVMPESDPSEITAARPRCSRGPRELLRGRADAIAAVSRQVF